MSFYSHTRSLGSAPGTQLNPIQDNSGGFIAGTGDQVVSTVGRFKRGRIDRSFKIDRTNINARLGSPESVRVSALNEAQVQLYEAVNNGAVSAVVSRLVPAAAKSSFGVVKIDKTTGATSFAAADTAPTDDYLLYVTDFECFNDGLKLSINAPKVSNAGVATDTKVITLRVCNPDGTLRYEATGSLDPTARDESGNDYFIGSIMHAVSSANVDLATSNTAVPATADCYGKNADGTAKFVTSAVVTLFAEGGTAYADTDYDAAIDRLENSSLDYGYCISAGAESVALVAKLATMNIRANRQFIVDVPGDFTIAQAIDWVSQLNVDSLYVQFYYAPLRTTDPLNGGRAVIGLGGYQAGLRCSRNAVKNAFGLAPKQYPIAGADWPLNRTTVEQLVYPKEGDLNDLADAKINPVLYEVYQGGGKYVFTDSLTSAKVEVSLRKLISVAEMATTLDNDVVMFSKETRQLPMDVAISRMDKFLKKRLKNMRSSNWLVASDDPDLGDNGFSYLIQPNTDDPYEQYDVVYSCRYNGTARKITVTQTLSR